MDDTEDVDTVDSLLDVLPPPGMQVVAREKEEWMTPPGILSSLDLSNVANERKRSYKKSLFEVF